MRQVGPQLTRLVEDGPPGRVVSLLCSVLVFGIKNYATAFCKVEL
jgi:hypothetical protein